MFRYLLGQLAAYLVNFASLIVLTRLLPRETYGALNVVSISLALASTLGAAGWPQAIVHFLAGVSPAREREIRRVISRGFLITSLSATAVIATIGGVARGTDHPLVVGLVIAPAVAVGAVSDYVLALLRASGDAGTYAALVAARRLLGLVGPVAAVLLGGPNLPSLAVGILVGEMGAMAISLAYRPRVSGGGGNAGEGRAIWRYSLATAIGLVGISLLSYGDRYVVERICGAGAVAVYSVVNGLVVVGISVVSRPLQLSAFPRYTALWRSEGAEATARYLAGAVRLYVWLAAPAAVMLAVEGPALLPIVAPRGYAAGHAMFAFLAAAFFLDGITWIANAGLHVGERTRIIAWTYPGFAALNLALNVAVVPHFGATGAAAVTFITFLGVFAVQTTAGFRILPVPLHPLRTMGTVALALALALAVHQLGPPSLAGVTLRAAAFALCYAVALTSLDSAARAAILPILRRCVGRRRPSV